MNASPQNPRNPSPAAAWAAYAEALADWAMCRLVNRRDAWGQYKSIGSRKNADDTTYTAKGELTLDILRRHFEGRDLGDIIGLHSTAVSEAGCTCLWAGSDYDRHDGQDADPEVNLDAVLAHYDRAGELGFRVIVEDSNGQGGYHLWVIFDRPVPTQLAHAFAQWLTRDWESLGLKIRPETYPKQPEVAESGYTATGSGCPAGITPAPRF